MFEQALRDGPWPGIALWFALRCAIGALGAANGRLYRAGVSRHFTYEKLFDDARQRGRIPRLLLGLAFKAGFIWTVWWASDRAAAGIDYPGIASEAYPFLIGGILLWQAWYAARLLETLVLFAYAARSLGVEGQVRFAYWLSLLRGSVDAGAFALAYFAAFLARGGAFLLGGATFCFIQAVAGWLFAESEREKAEGGRKSEAKGDAPEAR